MQSKLPRLGTTIFTVMSELANTHNALNLSQGFPDFSAPQALLERVTHHINHGHNQYAPMPGVPELRAAVTQKIADCYKIAIDSNDEITITSGATEALFSAIQAFVGIDDEVIVFDPAYDSYEPAVTLAGGKTIHVPLLASNFAIDWNRFSDALSDKTKLIILNSPHNPSGAVISQEDLDTLATLITDKPILILSDEVYEHIIFDGETHHSLLTHPELRVRSLVVSSFGKTYHATGWKIGYCVAPSELTKEFRKVHQFNQFCVATPLQHALADYLEEAPEHYQGLGCFYEQKRDYFAELLQDSRFSLTPSAGTYFQILDYSKLSTDPDTIYAEKLTREAGIASIPISVFYAEPPRQQLLRFCFAKDNSTLEKAAEILCKI
ncbi:MAG: methionine aminotransferase [Gammaproteobacteria bacterium]|nr:methionine aminotransferase [Gammaproteobacteria bacterium]